MPVTYSIASNALWLHIDGFSSPEEVKLTMISALKDPMFVKGMPLLIDMRNAEINFTVEEIRERANYYASLKEYIAPRCAIIATKMMLIVMSKVFQVFAENQGLQIHITSDIYDALSWLASPERIGREIDLLEYIEYEMEEADQRIEGITQPACDYL